MNSRIISVVSSLMRAFNAASPFGLVFLILAIRTRGKTIPLEISIADLSARVGIPWISLLLGFVGLLSICLFVFAIRVRRRTAGSFREIKDPQVVKNPFIGAIIIVLVSLFIPVRSTSTILWFALALWASGFLMREYAISLNPLLWILGYVPYSVKDRNSYMEQILLAERGGLHESLQELIEESKKHDTRTIEATVNASEKDKRRTLHDSTRSYYSDLGYTPLPMTRAILSRIGYAPLPDDVKTGKELLIEDNLPSEEESD